MAGSQGSRLRKVALTGVLTPGLILGAAGAMTFGAVPGASAQSVLSNGTCGAFTAPADEAATDMSPADVAEQINPAVVTILNMQPVSQADMSGFTGIGDIPGMPDIDELPGIDEVPGAEVPENAQQIEESGDDDTLVPAGSGSGFIVDELGRVVTNSHVVDGAVELTVVLFDGTEVPATVIGSEALVDVAIVQLDLPASVEVPGVAAFGDSERLRAGDQVVAIGNALGSFPNTVSEGTVNATDRAFPGAGGLTTMIQHDAEIWHGNSGGPLLNLQGQVIGINTAGIGSSTMGVDSGSADMAFAVEGNTVCKAAAELLEEGEIVWPYMGLQGEPSEDGQSIVEVVEDGPSAESGLEVGDVITAFDGQELGPQVSLIDLLFAREPGDVVDVTVDRDGDLETFQVTLGERPEITD